MKQISYERDGKNNIIYCRTCSEPFIINNRGDIDRMFRDPFFTVDRQEHQDKYTEFFIKEIRFDIYKVK
jgi:hypothetical protein